MDSKESDYIKLNLKLLNGNEIEIDKFIVNMFDVILNILNKISRSQNNDDIRSQFIEHIMLRHQRLYFSNSGMFCSYLKKFAKNLNMVEQRQQNRFVEFTDEIEIEGDGINPCGEEFSVMILIKNTGLSYTELAKTLQVSRQLLYLYVDRNEIPFQMRLKLKELDGYHKPIERAIELKEIILRCYGHLKPEAFDHIGVNRTYLFKTCKTGISYTQYIKIKNKIINRIKNYG